MTQVVINDSNLYDLIEKGEIVKNYFNPGNLFSRIVFLNLFREKKIRQRVPGIGQASTQILSFSIHPLIKVCTTSYFPELAQIFVFLIFRKHKTVFYDPELKLIRNFGHGLSLIIGGEIKKITGVPLITSLHGNPDVDYLRGRRSLGNPLFRMVGERQKKTEKRSLQHADFVMGVYSPIRPYLQKNLPARFVIVPNLLSKKMPLKKNLSTKKKLQDYQCGPTGFQSEKSHHHFGGSQKASARPCHSGREWGSASKNRGICQRKQTNRTGSIDPQVSKQKNYLSAR